ncbi:MAG: hypothetical protein J6K64_03185 [Clostridia bacterium]|nr:hypothetical protein [Clostridia bacterium]
MRSCAFFAVMKAHIRYDDIKIKTVPTMFDNRTYNIALTLNVIEKIQDKFGSLEKAMNKMTDMSVPVIKELIYMFIKDAIERDDFTPKLSEDNDSIDISTTKIGQCIGLTNLSYYSDCILQSMGESLPESEDEPLLDDEGNETIVTDEMIEALADMPDDPEPTKNLKAE